MKEQDYELLITLYEEANLTKASERLFISQPTATYRIQQMESALGIKVFHREQNSLIFTEEGKVLIEFASKQLDALSQMKDRLVRLKNEEDFPIKIGSSSNFAQYRLPYIIADYKQTFPSHKVNVISGYSSEMIQLLTSNDIQLGFITGNYEWHGERILLTDDPITIISKDPINLENLPKRPFIAYTPNPFSNKSFSPSNPISQIIMNWWHERFKDEPQLMMNLDKVETCKQMVNQNLGFSIVPNSCLKEDDELYHLPITTEKGDLFSRKTWLLYKKSSLEIATIRRFIDKVTDFLQVDDDKLQND